MRFTSIALRIAIAALATTTSSLAQSMDVAQFTKALERDWALAQVFVVPENIHVQYHDLLYPSMTDEGLRAAQSAIEGKPDHPLRYQVEPELRRRSKGPDRVDFEIWFQRSGTWRYNLTDHAQNLYVDQAATPSEAWSLMPMTLAVVEIGPNAPPNRNYAGSESSLSQAISEFVWAKLGMGKAIGAVPQGATVTQSGWTATAVAPTGYSWRGTGRLSDDAGRLLLEKGEILQAPNFPDEVGKTVSFLEWKLVESIGHWMCHRIEDRTADGRLVKVRILDSAKALDTSRIAELTRVPPVDGADIIRGKTTFASLLDYRRDAEKMTTFTPQGAVETPIPPSELGHANSEQLRTTGWVVMGTILLALIGFRISRARASRT
jgi:hypothetical protein